MKLPRNLSVTELVKGLERVGYVVSRQTGSHVGLTTERNGEHHITVLDHNPLKVGTLGGILADVAEHLEISRDDLFHEIFD
ncbi:MAG: type II toxin-antitoxin system HicA family toxin [Pirellulales bacterium]|nr:type II toxin-antitoxin system HicA family toxin [Pirellulales bacterium]